MTKLKLTFRNLANGSRKKLYSLPAQCIYVFPMILIINHPYFTKHSLLGPFFKLKQLFSVRYELEKKSKAVPLQAWSGPEGSRKLSFPDFMTTAQDGGNFVSLTHRPPLTPRNTPGTHFC